MPESKFVEVVAKSTRTKQRIPRHWLDHPILGRDFELPPSTRDTSVASSQIKPPKTAAVTETTDKTPATGDDKEK